MRLVSTKQKTFLELSNIITTLNTTCTMKNGDVL